MKYLQLASIEPQRRKTQCISLQQPPEVETTKSRIVTAGSQDDVPETVSKLSFTRVVAFNDLHDITIGERKIDRVSVLSPCLFLCWHGNKIDEIRRARQQEFKDFCASTFTEAR